MVIFKKRRSPGREEGDAERDDAFEFDAIASGNAAAFYADRTPDQIAVVQGSRRETWRDLDLRSRRLAHAMRRLGVAPGDTVINLLPSCIEHIEFTVGSALTDAVVAPIGSARGDQVAAILSDIRPSLVIAEDALWAEMLARDEILEETRAILVADQDGPKHCQWVPGAREEYESSLAACGPQVPTVVSSGGITMGMYRPDVDRRSRGRTELIAWDAEALRCARERSRDLWEWSDADVILISGGVHHPGPASLMDSVLFAGGRGVLMGEWDPTKWLETVEAERVTHCFLNPSHFKSLLKLPDDEWRSRDLSSLEMVIHGGSPCPVAVKIRIIERFAPAEVWEIFGSVDRVVTRIASSEWLEHPGSVGQPLPEVSVEVLASDGKRLLPGERGILSWVVAASRHGRAIANAVHSGPGRFPGEDLYVGYVDDDGFIHVTDRQVDGVSRNGTMVYPWELEEVLHGHREVEDCVVFAAATTGRDRELVALVQAPQGVDVASLEAHCHNYLPEAKCPDVIVLTEKIERDEVGKASRRALAVAYRHSTGAFRRRVPHGQHQASLEHGAGLSTESSVVGEAIRDLSADAVERAEARGPIGRADLDRTASVD